MQHYRAAIDTGGTCTDGVIMETDTQEVAATAKVSTTVSFPPFSAVGNAVGAGLAGLSRMETVKGYLS